ncbi:MAG: hypothetical protein K0S28_17 [Paucimonas sp.]|jgi:uncharacterized membrane protein|nr:hypothetical protein [Paucimonas sp.]
MSLYLTLKWLHIVSSVLLVGTGFGSAFYLYFIHRTHNTVAIAEVSRLVVRADFWFTAPAVIIQPLTGFAMMSIAGYPFSQPWIMWSLVLYAVAGACWLPVVWLQIKMSRMAAQTVMAGEKLPDRYWKYARYWEWLGYPAFVSTLMIFGLMVFKPSL